MVHKVLNKLNETELLWYTEWYTRRVLKSNSMNIRELQVVPPGPESIQYGISRKANVIYLNINKYNT